nr:hypothetical protein [Candidatus Sigynarchaeota archaeon]
MIFQSDYSLILLGFYIALILVQLLFGSWILFIFLQGKRKAHVSAPFILAMSLFFLFLTVGRVIFAWFDFVLTNFDDTTYPTYAGVWKTATAITTFGLALFVYQLEKKPLKNKTKGAITIIIILLIIILVVFPVTDLPSFNIDQYFVVFISIPMLITPFIYFYLAVKVNGYKKTGITIGLGILIYFLGEVSIAEFAVIALHNLGLDIELIYILAQIFKIIGIVCIGFAFVKEWTHFFAWKRHVAQLGQDGGSDEDWKRSR